MFYIAKANDKYTIKITTSFSKITLEHRSGLKALVTNFGATLMRLQFPDKNGKLQDLVAGYNLPEYYNKPPYTDHNFCIGATIGRYAGRISGGGFFLEGSFYPLKNDRGVHLHGGSHGFDKQFWNIKEHHDVTNPYVVFELSSPEGHSGYPGNLVVTATYQLTEDSLWITYEAKTDKTTILNLTNHAYFHLDDTGSVSGNELYINAPSILAVDEKLVPNGNLHSVHNTPWDYQKPIPLEFMGHNGLDTPYVLREGKVAASIYSPDSGIKMDVETNQPAVVVFTPQKFPKLGLRQEEQYKRFPAICFECQNFPDAPNHSNFPSAELRPGTKYLNQIRYRFSTK